MYDAMVISPGNNGIVTFVPWLAPTITDDFVMTMMMMMMMIVVVMGMREGDVAAALSESPIEAVVYNILILFYSKNKVFV